MRVVAIALPLLLLSACGSTGGTPVASATIALSAGGLSESEVRLKPGGRITFTNNDTAKHRPSSNPHPTHTDCPELNAPELSMGQSFSATIATGHNSCGFHDHLNPTNSAFHGSILVITGSSVPPSSGY